MTPSPTLRLRAALLSAAVALLAQGVPSLAQTTSEATPVAARVVAVRSMAQPFEDRLVIRGRTEADRRVELRAELAGLVVSEPIRKGAQVRAGDVLCRIGAGERPAALAEAEAALRQAEAEVAAARSLSERGFTAATEALTREAQLESARARLERARIDMARLDIAAPFDGVLETDAAETGSLMQPGSLCATLLALDPIALVGYATERDVDRLHVGSPAQARLVTGRRIEGAIRFVSRSADEQTRTFRIEVAAPNPDLAIRDGMTAEIVVTLGAGVAHFAPQSALTLDDAGRLGVRLVEDGRARFAPVEILRDAPDGVWLGGLPRDAAIIVVGQEFVDDGASVTPTYVAASESQALRREFE